MVVLSSLIVYSSMHIRVCRGPGVAAVRTSPTFLALIGSRSLGSPYHPKGSWQVLLPRLGPGGLGRSLRPSPVRSFVSLSLLLFVGNRQFQRWVCQVGGTRYIPTTTPSSPIAWRDRR